MTGSIHLARCPTLGYSQKTVRALSKGDFRMTRARYQAGCITLRKRAKGADIWQFRWWELNQTGGHIQRSRIVGSVERFPTRRDAQCAADALRLEVNAELPNRVPITVATLIDRYLNDQLEMDRLAFATKKSYTTYLNHWVKPKWVSTPCSKYAQWLSSSGYATCRSRRAPKFTCVAPC